MTVDVVRPPRPAQVTVAFWLLLSGAVLMLGIVALAVAQAVQYDGEISRALALVPDADPGEVSDERNGNVAAALFLGIPPLLLAVWLAVTARPVLRGSNIARIFVFVAAGGQLLLAMAQFCGGLLLAPLAFMSDGSDGGDGSWEPSKFSEVLYSSSDTFAEVAYVSALLVTITVLTVSCAVVLLLTLPPAHRYYVPRATPAWPSHPALGPMPYYICPDPSVHYRLAPPPTAVTAEAPAPPATAEAPAPPATA